WLAENAIETLYKKAKQHDYDIVCYKFFHVDGKKVIKSSRKKTGNDRIGGDEFLRMIMTSEIMPSLWSKLIKRDFIFNNDPVFPNGIKKAQDLAFSCSLGVHLPNACYIDEYLYFYDVSRNASVTNTVSPILLDVKKATDFVQKLLK